MIKTIEQFLLQLRENIISTFESIEPQARFQRTAWPYQKGKGGGEMALLRGTHFEKGAVNFSSISGDHFPFDASEGSFVATGVSLITHMANPHTPTVHFNIRYLQTEKRHWFGGGYDLTPMGFPYAEDTAHFHHVAKKTLGDELYTKFSADAKEYFFIPHRNKERGVGGIFFDHYNSGNFDTDFTMWKRVGETFLDAVMPIYHRRVEQPYSSEEKETQSQLRAHYVEFNLLYDRGTKFGFQSGGNPEAILCSMPPVAKW